jgi:hypothetical protein|tara:strand:- start:208 stop:1440 length:1233 start_codon:yes stop_codon:yes gene_type:complete
MKSYKQFLIEASGKNLHMEHLEDEVLNGGVNGTRGAINFLRSLRDMLAGNNKEAVNVTVKWDGAPAAVAGIHPNGKFFVDYKSMRKPCFTQSDVDEHFGGGPLHPKMSALLEHLPKLNIPGNIFHGDVLWTDNKDKKIKTIDKEKYVTFTPNTITYAVPLNTELAKKIIAAKVGIVFHTTYRTTGADDLNDLRAEFGADINLWSSHRDVWAVNADFTDLSGSATFTQSDTTKVTGMLSELGKDFNKVNGRFLDNISKDNIIRTHIKTFMNTKVREGEFVDNYKRSAKDCVKWIENKMQKEVGKLKSERGRQRKQMTVDGYMKTLNGSMDQIEIIFRLMSLINNIKLFIVKKLEEVKGITNTFIKTSSGYRVTKPEGFVAIDTFDNQKGLKLVNRMEFSRINFTAEKEWDQ